MPPARHGNGAGITQLRSLPAITYARPPSQCEAAGAPMVWPPDGSADIWQFDIGMLLHHAARSLAWLDDAEYKRVQKFLTTDARHAFLSGRYALRALLSRYLQMAPGSIVFAKNAYGKPMLAQSALKFNISHSGPCLLIGIARCDIGVDVQVPVHARTINGLLASLSPAEANAVAASPPSDARAQAVLRCWSRKEAVSKAIGMGLSLDPKSYSVPAALACTGVPVPVDGHGTWWVSTLGTHACAAVATASALAEIRLYRASDSGAGLLWGST